MKKIIIISSCIMYSILNASDIHFSSSSIDAGRYGTGIENSIGVVFDNKKKQIDRTGLYWGVNFDIGLANLDTENLINYNFGLRLGYTPIKDLNVYGIASGAIQNVEDLDAYGFGYGVGIDYQIFESFAIGAEYKTYTMTPNVNGFAGANYDYEMIGMSIKYIF